MGNPVNISCVHHCHAIVSSLTKIFSGDSNVMAGSLVLNPRAPDFLELCKWVNCNFNNQLWCEDVMFLERNSRSFRSRILRINTTTEILCDKLRTHPLVSNLFYPKYDCRHYDQYANLPGQGYGGLFSIVLVNEDYASRFYDSLMVLKGPSLGTNFTLVCPYTILAHYFELEWAASFGVEKHLIRVSVGLEDPDALFSIFELALTATQGGKK